MLTFTKTENNNKNNEYIVRSRKLTKKDRRARANSAKAEELGVEAKQLHKIIYLGNEKEDYIYEWSQKLGRGAWEFSSPVRERNKECKSNAKELSERAQEFTKKKQQS